MPHPVGEGHHQRPWAHFWLSRCLVVNASCVLRRMQRGCHGQTRYHDTLIGAKGKKVTAFSGCPRAMEGKFDSFNTGSDTSAMPLSETGPVPR